MDLTRDGPLAMIREARPTDAEALVELIAGLGFEVDSPGVRERIAKLAVKLEPILVANIQKRLAGVLDWHVMHTIHRPAPGRIAMLVVAPDDRGRSIGRPWSPKPSSGCALQDARWLR